MKYKTTILLILSIFQLSFESSDNINLDNTNVLYEKIKVENSSIPKLDVFQKAFIGFNKLKKEKAIKKDIITVIDFRLSANKKRLWVIDLNTKKVLFNTYVAHGRNTGQEYSKNFSNVPESHKSSLGFYVTSSTYYGKHGLSLYLDGKESGFNDNARKRAIVMHGANYVNTEFIKKNGRLGRSFGCPAVPMKLNAKIVNTIKGNSCLFIYYPNKEYEQNSKYLN